MDEEKIEAQKLAREALAASKKFKEKMDVRTR